MTTPLPRLNFFKKRNNRLKHKSRGLSRAGQGSSHKLTHIGTSGISQLEISDEQYELMRRAFCAHLINNSISDAETGEIFCGDCGKEMIGKEYLKFHVGKHNEKLVDELFDD